MTTQLEMEVDSGDGPVRPAGPRAGSSAEHGGPPSRVEHLCSSVPAARKRTALVATSGPGRGLGELTVGARQPLLLTELLVARAQEQPDHPVYTQLVDGETEGASLTFAALDSRARQIAATLRAAGAAGERVVVMVTDELAFIEAFFGVLYAGAVVVPAYPPLRPQHTARTAGVFEDARARFAIAPARTLELFRAVAGGGCTSKVRGLACEDLHGDDDGAAPAATHADAVCFLQYTSGSTGLPKGVSVTFGNIAANLEMITPALGLGPQDALVTWNPLFHDMGLMAGVLFPLHSGCRAYLMAPRAFVQRPERLLRAVDRYRAGLITGPNFSYQLMADAVGPEARAELDLSCLRVALNGAEPLRTSTLEAFEEAFSPCGLGQDVLTPAYGLAEATVYVSGGPPGGGWRSHRRGALVGHGTGAEGQLLRIVDPASSTACAAGITGEIWIAGAHVTPGYWNRTGSDTETFGSIAGEDGGARYLRTGDLGFLDPSGELYVTGRLKDLLIIRGRNYSPADLERVAEEETRTLGVTASAAFAVGEDGDEEVVVVLEAVFAAAGAAAIERAVVRAVSREVGVQVADVVVANGRLARTTSGKVQRHLARRAYLERPVGPASSMGGAGA